MERFLTIRAAMTLSIILSFRRFSLFSIWIFLISSAILAPMSSLSSSTAFAFLLIRFNSPKLSWYILLINVTSIVTVSRLFFVSFSAISTD